MLIWLKMGHLTVLFYFYFFGFFIFVYMALIYLSGVYKPYLGFLTDFDEHPFLAFLTMLLFMLFAPLTLTYILTRNRDIPLAIVYVIPIMLFPLAFLYLYGVYGDQIYAFILNNVTGGDEKTAKNLYVFLFPTVYVPFLYIYAHLLGKHFKNRKKKKRKKDKKLT